MSIADPDLLAASLRDADIEYLRLAPGPFTARLTALDLGAVRLQIAADRAHISRGHVAAGTSMLLIGLDLPQDGTQMNGIGVGTNDIVHLGPGAPVFARVNGPIQWAAVSFEDRALHDAIPAEALPVRGAFLYRRAHASHAALAALTGQAAILVARDPMRFALPDVRKAMAEDMLRASLTATQGPAAIDAPFRAIRRRVVLVSRAEEILDGRIGDALYSEDLQQALGVPMRTLHNAFVAVHGMSVHRYLRLRRLHLARAALRRGPRSVSHVKIAALSLGFWHLGRFAQDYRDLFGELPSDTIGRRNAG